MQTEHIHFASNGDTAPGFLAYPEPSPAGPGVVVIQEWWGLDGHIQDVTTRVAGAGYVALAPDLYHGKITVEPDEARKTAMALDYDRVALEIDSAVAHLLSLDYVSPKRIGVIGFCMGGGLALHTAARNPHINAVVAFYGGRPPRAEAFANRDVAVLNIVGEKDSAVLDAVRDLNDGLDQTANPHKLIVYPGVGHAFFNDTRLSTYNVGVAQRAWAEAMQWFRYYLKEN